MYGIGGTEELEQLLGTNTTQLESPQLLQGLLGSTGDQSQVLDELFAKSANTAAQLSQYSQMMNPDNGLLAQRQAAGQQSAQQAMAQQQQQQAQNGQMLMKLAMMFI